MIILRVFSLFLNLFLLVLLVACTKPNGDQTSSSPSSSLPKDDRTFNVSVFTTKGDQSLLLKEQSPLVLKQERGEGEYEQATLSINEDVKFQEMDGFGAALTESSAYLINTLPDTKREEVIKDLFSDDGIRLNFVRLPMGASDFALDSYTYNDLPIGTTDLDLEQFSIARDEAHVIPILKNAFNYNNQIKLMGSPWSAPAWMKTSGNLNHGSLKKEYFNTYANYFVKFIEAYEENGLPIYAVTLQNEPLHESWSYPSMKMSNDDQRDLIKIVGPKFEEEAIDTKIIAYDHNWDQRTYPYKIYQDPIANSYVSGAGYHCYAGEVESQSLVHNAFPEKGIWFTECSGGAWSKNFGNNLVWNMENLFIGSVNHYSKAVLLWNIALDENFGPKNGGCQDCRGVLEVRSDGTVERNVEYYSIGHFSKFVDSGAYRIESTIDGNKSLIATTFKNPNGEIVVVMCNTGSNQLKVKMNYDGLTTYHTLPSKSVSTLIIEK